MTKPSLGAPAPASPFFSPAPDQSTVANLKVTVQSVTPKPDGSLQLSVVSGNVRFGVTIFNLPGRPDFKPGDRLILEYPKGQNPLTDYTAIYHADAVTTVPQPSLLHRSNNVSEISTVQNNALIPTFQSTIGGKHALCCDGRALHIFLGNARQFSDWMKQRIEQYDFKEGRDFEAFSQKSEKPQGGRPTTEYHLTINMAKELSMVENNEQGKIARRYFIECESIALGNSAKELPQHKARKSAEPKQTPTQLVRAMLLIGNAVQKVEGVNVALAMSLTLDAIEVATGMPTRMLTRALPSVEIDNAATLNATKVGEPLNMSNRAVNTTLEQLGFQYRDENKDWKLTEAGTAYGEMKPYHRNGHSGYEVRWKPSVVDVLRNSLKNDKEAA